MTRGDVSITRTYGSSDSVTGAIGGSAVLVLNRTDGEVLGTSGNTLVGYAVLRANYNASAPNYLDNFCPFVLSVVAQAGKPFLERHVIAETVRREFGIEIPAMVVTRLLRRTNRQGLTEALGNESVGLTPKGLKAAPALASEVTQYRRKQTELVQVFKEFVTTRYPEHVNLVSGDVGVMLADYFNRHAVPLLNEGLRGRARADSPRPGIEFLVSSFVTHLASGDQARFDYVLEAAKGAMLASVLVIDTTGLKDSLNNLVLVFDTPVLMDALGFHGELPKSATDQLFSLARDQGAKLVAFDHSVGELDGILESIAQSLRRGGRARSTSAGFLHFAETGATPADIVILQQKLQALLTSIGVEIVARPDGYYQYGLDEKKLEDLIQARVRYLQDAARTNDVLSLSATHRLRKGTRAKALEHCGATLVTSNTGLVRGAMEFDSAGGSFPLAITTEALASILWVRSPATAPDAPRQILLASAFAGMQPSAHLWSKYLDEVDRLEKSETVSADEAIVLRSSRSSRDALMEETLGESDAPMDEAPLAVLDRVRRGVAAPLEEKVNALTARAAAADAVAVHTSEDWLKQVDAKTEAQAKFAELAEAHGALSATIRSAEREEQQKRERIRKRSEEIARRAVRGIAWSVRLLALVVTFGAIALFVTREDPSDRTGVLLVGVIGILTFMAPFVPTLDGILSRWEEKFADRGERKRLLDAGYQSTSSPSPSLEST